MKTQDALLIEYVMLLRYGPQKNIDFTKPLINCSAIAKMIKIPYRTLLDLLKIGKIACELQKPIYKRVRTKLN